MFGSCNVDENAATAMLLPVQSIPTVVAFGPDGSEVGRLVGVATKARLDALVASVAAGAGSPPA